MILGSPEAPDNCDHCQHLHCSRCDEVQQLEKSEYWVNKKTGHNCRDCSSSDCGEKKEGDDKGNVEKAKGSG